MKQELTVQGRVELSREEVTEAVMNFVSSEKTLTKAIDAWLLSKHHLSSTRVRYSKDDGGIQKAVVDIKKKVAEGSVTKFSDDPKAKKQTADGFTRRNVGVFKFIKEYIQDELKKGKKKMTFDEMSEQVKFSFPNMDEKRLAIYLHDKRMLPNLKFSKPENVIQFA